MSLTKPVFIIAQHRTGSTLLKNILGNHADLCMVEEEMDWDNPWRRDLKYYYYKNNSLKTNKDVINFVDIVCNGTLHGTFWQKKCLEKRSVHRDQIIKKILKGNKGFSDVINSILKVILENDGKDRIGVKFPVHFRKVNGLKSSFPDSKIIYLIRDPRGMIASKLNHKATIRRMKKIQPFGFIVYYITLLLFLIEFVWFNHLKNKNDEPLIRYEDLVTNPKGIMDNLFDFCELTTIDETSLYNGAYGQPTSYGEKLYEGVSGESLVRWKKSLNKFDLFLIKLIAGRVGKKVGYDL